MIHIRCIRNELKCLVLSILAVLLIGCGNKGDLYLPDKSAKSIEQPDVVKQIKKKEVN